MRASDAHAQSVPESVPKPCVQILLALSIKNNICWAQQVLMAPTTPCMCCPVAGHWVAGSSRHAPQSIRCLHPTAQPQRQSIKHGCRLQLIVGCPCSVAQRQTQKTTALPLNIQNTCTVLPNMLCSNCTRPIVQTHAQSKQRCRHAATPMAAPTRVGWLRTQKTTTKVTCSIAPLKATYSIIPCQRRLSKCRTYNRSTWDRHSKQCGG